MQWILVVLMLFFALPAFAQVKFMQIGDPQIGKRTTSLGVDWYEDLSDTEVIAYQERTLHGLLQYAEDIGVKVVIMMGDMTDNDLSSGAYPAQIAPIKAEMAEHSDLTFYFVTGNHDIAFVTCKNLTNFMMDPIDGTFDRVPLWQEIDIGNVRLFMVTDNLWAYYWPNCRSDGPLAPGGTIASLDDDCTANGRTSTGSCAAGTVTDARAQHTCDTDEVCARYDDYTDAMMAALEDAITAYEVEYAAGTANVFGVVGHFMPWTDNDVDNQNNNNNSWHNETTCTENGGGSGGDYCNDLSAFLCTGADTCDTPVVGGDYRTQFETAALNLSTTLYGFTGHIHKDQCYPLDCDCTDPETTNNGLNYCFVASTGSAIPYSPQTTLTGNIWTCGSDGDCAFETILATPQGVEVFDVELHGVSIP